MLGLEKAIFGGTVKEAIRAGGEAQVQRLDAGQRPACGGRARFLPARM